MKRTPKPRTSAKNKESREPAPKIFPIVGVGSSAGGLEAISEFLRHIPESTGLAFVFIQHLDPHHRSALTEILSRESNIPIEEAQEGMPVRVDRGYVIPPNTEMYIERGNLRLVPRQRTGALSLPVDRFFSSLTADRQHRSIGVILSGTGSDGVEGCKMIKEAGGITFAQTEDSAKYAGMPQSAVDAGCVDFVLSPKEIAEKLVQIGTHPYVARNADLEALNYSENDMGRLFYIVSGRTGVDFSQYKQATLRRRIQRRMALQKFSELKDYIQYLSETPGEADDLYRDILITVTNFFRDPESFDALKRSVFNPLLEGANLERPLRIWVPACATGEEAYSIAMALTEFLSESDAKRKEISFQIFASDVNETSLAKARLGVYSEAIVKDLTPARLNRFFVKRDGMYHIQKSIRESCIFARQNVAKDPPFSNLDLISCRNLLIYLGAALQARVIPTFHYALRPGGYLMLGGSETLGKFADQFLLVDKRHKIYEKKKGSPQVPPYLFTGGIATTPKLPTHPSREQSSAHSLERQFDRALLETFGLSSIIVNEQMEIVHLRGETSRYLTPPSGQPSFSLNKMARDGLLLDTRAAINSAKKTGKAVQRKDLEIETETGPSRVDLEVQPFMPSGSKERYYIILLREYFPASGKTEKLSRTPRRVRKETGRAEAQRLRKELANTKVHLKTLIEDHDTALEEYRSSNEEVMSSNEELQSVNEELETSKEELQSTNEELRTLNEALQNRNIELITSSDDLRNLFSNADLPLLMVSNDLVIRHFTPQAESLLNVNPAMTGRRLAEVRPNLRHENLANLAREVIASAEVHEAEVQSNEGRWYLMRVRAYRTSTHQIGGAVFAFHDIDLLKRSLDESRSYTATLIESAREPILVLDSALRVVTANDSFYKTFRVTPEQTEGKFVYDLVDGQWRIPELRTLLEKVLPARSHIDDFEVRADFPQIGSKVMHLNARRIESQVGKEAILLAIEDVTVLKRSEEALRNLSTTLLKLQEIERGQIARDLHDVTGQKVAALRLNVKLLSKLVPDAKENRILLETLELTEQITNEIRTLSYILHPPMLDELGLVPALREYFEGVSQRTGLKITSHMPEPFPRLPEDIEITVFRIIQECLTNVHTHAGATDVSVELRCIGNQLIVEVADSGRGFPPEFVLPKAEQAAVVPGVGLAGIRERVRHLGGTLELSNRRESGAGVATRIPIPDGPSTNSKS